MWYRLTKEEVQVITASVHDIQLVEKLQQPRDKNSQAFEDFARTKYESDDITVEHIDRRTTHGAYVLARLWVFNHEIGKSIDLDECNLSPGIIDRLRALPGFRVDNLFYQGDGEADGRIGKNKWSLEYNENKWTFKLTTPAADVIPELFVEKRWSYTQLWAEGPVEVGELLHERAFQCILEGYEKLKDENPLGCSVRVFNSKSGRLIKSADLEALVASTDLVWQVS